MNHNKELKKTNSYEDIHNNVIINDKISAFNIILPILIIIMIISVMFIYTFNLRDNLIDDTEHVTNQMAEYIASSISNKIDYASSSIKLSALSISETMDSNNLEDPSNVIGPMVNNTPFENIEYIDADGMNIMNIGEPFDASDRIYYKEGIKGNTGIWNNFNPARSKETLMNFYTPIIYNNEIVGVITGYIASTTQIAPLFESKLYDEEIYGILVDENNMVICSTIEAEYVPNMTLDMLLDTFSISKEDMDKVSNIINDASNTACTYKSPDNEGRICVVTIPNTNWKIVILIPDKSINAMVYDNIKDSLLTIIIIGLLLVSYAAFVLFKNIKRRKDITRLNEKLENDNQKINAENKKAFNELAEIRDIISSANMGTWRIVIEDGLEPKMYVDDTMKKLLGIDDKERTPEETYKDWFSNITKEALDSVLKSVDKMKDGYFDENTYLWNHPIKGIRYVRCGGTAITTDNGHILRGYHYDVDEVVRDDLNKVQLLHDALNEKNDYYTTIGTIGGIFNSMHVIDLINDKVVELNANEQIQSLINHSDNLAKMMADVIGALVIDEYKKEALEFTDLLTISDRMVNRKVMTKELVGKNLGWFLASFITMDVDEHGKPIKFIFTTRSIDAEKKHEEILIKKSQTDELTGLLNRRAYEEDIYEHNDIPDEENFVYISLDVNGLKVVNDSMGHSAGDELLIGASECMKSALGKYGKIYRTGGDEFIAILVCDEDELGDILYNFDEIINNWTGKIIDGLSISYGYISKDEEPDLSVRQMALIADERMYEAKNNHYKKQGIDRKGQRAAHIALCSLYTKILKINLSDDSYQIINLDDSEKVVDKGFSDTVSSWLRAFGESGQIHEDDLSSFMEKTDFDYIKNYFNEGNTSLHIFYRRKIANEYKQVMMEIIPANDYDNDNYTFFLYVKDID